MKLLCIDDRFINDGKHPVLKYGETYESTGEALNMNREECYILPDLPVSFCSPYRLNKGPYYRKTRFIPLSGLDETELVNEEWEEKYCVLVNQKL